ncbi:uncharacterized protein Ecym_5003 [Eremothecium cymbalariae DBVPG|uniref:Uncharacterized protein n=1 Tax=Eremothecium cymbalariae (strain CBS 270.75 / DBVPG 7215 / KCTC 17166 / NRRL Y-17582) TaxID=931890 RepID=I6NCL4_ERECY|nr:hypothetical protein Ecym_5003 [Eremothecium cymbalariae DBVPG\
MFPAQFIGLVQLCHATTARLKDNFKKTTDFLKPVQSYTHELWNWFLNLEDIPKGIIIGLLTTLPALVLSYFIITMTMHLKKPGNDRSSAAMKGKKNDVQVRSRPNTGSSASQFGVKAISNGTSSVLSENAVERRKKLKMAIETAKNNNQ